MVCLDDLGIERSNRTFMELKFVTSDTTFVNHSCSNRTFMELKCLF